MIKHIRTTTLLWLAIVATLPLYAQQQKEHTLGSLWSKVEENYPGVGAKTSAIDAAKFNQRAVKGNMLPQVNAQAQNTYGTYEGSAGRSEEHTSELQSVKISYAVFCLKK